MTESEWQEQMGGEILSYIREELCLDFPFFDLALFALTPKPYEIAPYPATDGETFWYPPQKWITLYKQNEQFLERTYLHSMLHCLYGHLWISGGRDTKYWNLACDIAVEYVIDTMDKPSVKRILTWTRQRIYEQIEQQKCVSAAQIHEFLLANVTEDEEFEGIRLEFLTDDHRCWPRKENQKNQKKVNDDQQSTADNSNDGSQEKENRKDTSDHHGNDTNQNQKENLTEQKWKQIARKSSLQRDRSGKNAIKAADLLKAQAEIERRRVDYREFLKKFASFHEELRTDLDDFDLAYYTYGLATYGNLPLIEPLETREEKRIRAFVIAIDTSYSTSGDLVKSFLQETFEILHTEHIFSGQVCIHIIQADEKVQTDDVITNKQELKRYLSAYEVRGGGNTDFRPVFSYVETLRKEGKLRDLAGLLYFTDGEGIYPQRKPDYRTAFLYLSDYDAAKVPAWAMQFRVFTS